jgi:hypothetical protein
VNSTHYAGAALIDDRRLRFDAIAYQARLRITLTGPGLGQQGDTLGSVVALDTDNPRLLVSAPLHVEWATTHYEEIQTEATRIWTAIQRDCDG